MLEATRRRRAVRRLYRLALKAGLTDLGVRMRNEVARGLQPGEVIVEDDAVLISDAQGVGHRSGQGLGRYGWMVVTNQRVVWAIMGSKRSTEVSADALERVYAEDDFETYRWDERRKSAAVTFGFGARDQVKSHLHNVVGLHDG